MMRERKNKCSRLRSFKHAPPHRPGAVLLAAEFGEGRPLQVCRVPKFALSPQVRPGSLTFHVRETAHSQNRVSFLRDGS